MGPAAQPQMIVGRAKTVLVVANQAVPLATITAVLARWTQTPSPLGVLFTGPVRFADDTREHVYSTVLPLIHRIARLLGLAPGSFEVSAVNLAAASHLDLGLEISGFSADLPLFLAMVSARLDLALPQDVVSTGHIASPDGDVRVVQNLPAKLEAVRVDDSIRRVILPAPDADASLALLAQTGRAEIAAATARARQEQEIHHVRDIAGLLARVFAEEQVIPAALAHGCFGRRVSSAAKGTPIHQAASFLAASPRRFYDALAWALMAGAGETARDLLTTWTTFHISRGHYPRGFGRTLAGILQSLPPSSQQGKLRWPLLPGSLCIALSQHASPRDTRDVLELYDAVSKPAGRERVARSTRATQPAPRRSESPSLLESVLAEIDPRRLAAAVGTPIDTARASFRLKTVTLDDHRHIVDVVTSFHIQLLRSTGRTTGRVDRNQVGSEAYALLERAFGRSGGAPAAIAEAQTGTRGGLRFVLDQMTEQYKRERTEEHVRKMISTALDPLDFAAKVAFIREFLARFPDAVPPECAAEPPERYATRYDLIARVFVDSMERVRQLLRAL